MKAGKQPIDLRALRDMEPCFAHKVNNSSKWLRNVYLGPEKGT